MDAEIVKTFGQIAGIGGLGLVVVILIFRDIIAKSIFPTLTKDDAYRLLRLLAVFVFIIALASIGAWVWAEQRGDIGGGSQKATIDGSDSQINQTQGGGTTSQDATIKGNGNKINQKSGSE